VLYKTPIEKELIIIENALHRINQLIEGGKEYLKNMEDEYRDLHKKVFRKSISLGKLKKKHETQSHNEGGE